MAQPHLLSSPVFLVMKYLDVRYLPAMITASGMLVNQHVVIYSFFENFDTVYHLFSSALESSNTDSNSFGQNFCMFFFSKRTLLNYARRVLANFKVKVYKEVRAAVS